MAGPKAFEGFRSRTDAAVAMTAQGLAPAQIASRIGIDRNAVTALLASASRRRSPRPAEQTGATVLFSKDVLSRLRPHAIKRQITVNELARRIVEAVVDDNIVNAVLED